MLCILGPTASGKSALAMQLAGHDPRIELISMDSAQIYRDMDVGSAKPSPLERAQVRHHLVDLLEPSESYSAARFVRDATQAADDIRARGGIPVLVGGTMLYYKAYVEGLDDLPSTPLEIRRAISQQAAAQGWPALHALLKTVDPDTAQRLHPADAQRISRALEIYRHTGKTMTAWIRDSATRSAQTPSNREGVQALALFTDDRAELHRRIEERFKQMVAHGLLEEVRRLRARGDLTPDLPSMRCVGYRQAWHHLDGTTSYSEFLAQGVAATRQLAKRQITWLRRFTDIERFDPFDPDQWGQAVDRARALAR